MSSTSTTVTRISSSSGAPRQQQGNTPRGSGTTGFPHMQHTRAHRPNDPPQLQQNHQKSKGGKGNPTPAGPPAAAELPVSAAAASVKDVVSELLEAKEAHGRPSASAAPTASGHLCVVCCDPIEYFSLGPCNHHEVCHVCSLRMRALYKNNACSFCKVGFPHLSLPLLFSLVSSSPSLALLSCRPTWRL